jgi:hypothetical protein
MGQPLQKLGLDITKIWVFQMVGVIAEIINLARLAETKICGIHTKRDSQL